MKPWGGGGWVWVLVGGGGGGGGGWGGGGWGVMNHFKERTSILSARREHH